VKRFPWLFVIATPVLLTVLATVPTTALAANGNASPTLSFFSGGDGAHAGWLATSDQPPRDTDGQAIQLQTTDDAPTFTKGYAGILVHYVAGIPATSFPDSSFWVKTPAFTGPSLGSPRLVVEFQTAAGALDGDAELDPNALTGSWQHVSDVADYPDSGWDIHSATCPFLYHQKWKVAQSCHADDTVSAVFLVADPYGINHLIDDINIDGKTFSDAANNSNGDNNPAGPAATTDPSLLPPLIFPPL
jgi:hypothetical protein